MSVQTLLSAVAVFVCVADDSLGCVCWNIVGFEVVAADGQGADAVGENRRPALVISLSFLSTNA